MQGTTNPPKRQRAAQTRLVQSIVRLTKVKQEANRKENAEKGRAQNTNESNKNMHWRGTSAPVTSTDRHTSTESHAQTPYTWEDGTPVHLSRLRKDTPVKMTNPNDQNGEGRTSYVRGNPPKTLPSRESKNAFLCALSIPIQFLIIKNQTLRHLEKHVRLSPRYNKNNIQITHIQRLHS